MLNVERRALKIRTIVIVTVTLLLLYPSAIFADTRDTSEEYINFKNIHGLEIPEEDYIKLRKVFTEPYLAVMTKEEFFDKMTHINFDNVKKQEKYLKLMYDNRTGETTSSVVTEEEYLNSGNAVMPLNSYYELSYIYVAVDMSREGEEFVYGSVDVIWYAQPVVRSFDVIGIRTVNMSVINGTQGGKQIYKTNGDYQTINYLYNGTNTKNFDNGFGISMNIVNPDVTYLQCSIDSIFVIDAFPAIGFGAYEHANKNMSLAQSQTYTLASTGKGDVFYFPSESIRKHYSNLEGLHEYFLE